jgi:uncharacterized integral membrane protein
MSKAAPQGVRSIQAMSAPSAQIPGPPAGKRKTRERRKTSERVRAVFPVLLAALAIAFAVVNLKQVKVDWIVGSGHAPLIIVIVISLLVGVVVTHLAERVGRRRR